jgi:hypothetical protein
MKNFLRLLSFSICCVICFASCKKERHKENELVTLNVTIAAGDTYKLDVSQYGDADDNAAISKQASDFNISEINTVNGRYVYSFSRAGGAKLPATGTDEVVLKLTEPEGRGRGRCQSHDETTIKIHFTVQ